MKRIKAAILRWARPVSTPVGELFRYRDDYGHPASYAKCRECGWDVYFEPLDTIQKWNFCANCGTGLDWRAFESVDLTPEASGAIDKLDALAALLESGEAAPISTGEYRVPFAAREAGSVAAEALTQADFDALDITLKTLGGTPETVYNPAIGSRQADEALAEFQNYLYGQKNAPAAPPCQITRRVAEGQREDAP